MLNNNIDESVNSGTSYLNKYHADINSTEVGYNFYQDALKDFYLDEETSKYVKSNFKEHITDRINNKTDNTDSSTESIGTQLSNTFNITSTDLYNMFGAGDIFESAETTDKNRFNKFARYGYLDPSGELITGAKEYLFFSKPDLHLVNPSSVTEINSELKNSPFFIEAFNRYKNSYYALQQYYAGSSPILKINDYYYIDLKCLYIPLLTNMVSSTLDLPDVTASEVQTNQNLYQTSLSYREGSLSSDLQYDFSLEFRDTKFLDVYMLFKIYDEYFKYKYMAEVTPTRLDYIFNKIYPEALSIWKLIVDDTGRIMFWAKATGCTPMSVPRATISNLDGTIKFTINWKAQFVRDMDPVSLDELNYLTYKSLGNGSESSNGNVGGFLKSKYISNGGFVSGAIPNYSDYRSGKTWVGLPFIVSNQATNPMRPGTHDTSNSSYTFHRLVWV